MRDEYYYTVLTGRNRTATDSTGVVIHAIEGDGNQYPYFGAAVCGAKPGRLSNGWSYWRTSAPTCPKCIKKLEKVTA